MKIVDFGIAKAALRDQQTQAGVIKGKYFYMSPEQALGEKIDARTDVFSTGILLYEMLVGEMLYLEDDLHTLLKMVRAADIKPPSRKRPDVPPELDAIVMKALAKRPEDRYQSAADLATALIRFLRANFPDSGRARVSSFFHEVLEREPSRAEITMPPLAVEDFADENSLIFDLKHQRRVSAKDAHRADEQRPGERRPPQGDDLRRGDRHTRGMELPRSKPAASDFEEAGATEYDDQPRAGYREPVTDPDPAPARAKAPAPQPAGAAAPDFGQVGDDAEPTEFARGARAAARHPPAAFVSDADDEATSTHVPKPSPPSTPERPRRATGAPAPAPIGTRRSTLPPVASPAPAPRTAMGLGVSEPERRVAQARPAPGPAQRAAAPARASEPEPRADNRGAPAPGAQQASSGLEGFAAQGPPTGSQPLVDWSTEPTVTPQKATPYTPSSGDYQSLHSSITKSPGARRRKLILVAGAVLFISAMIVGVALIWPDGPARGSIEVISAPAGATVRIDGTVLSRLTPIRIGDIDVRQPHHLAVSLRGYDTWENDAKFEGGDRDLRLQAILVPAVGTLDVSTVPPGAEAIVNGRISGVTPTKVGDLPPNEDVTLELRLRGYKVVYRTLQWSGKRAMSVTVPLEKAH